MVFTHYELVTPLLNSSIDVLALSLSCKSCYVEQRSYFQYYIHGKRQAIELSFLELFADHELHEYKGTIQESNGYFLKMFLNYKAIPKSVNWKTLSFLFDLNIYFYPKFTFKDIVRGGNDFVCLLLPLHKLNLSRKKIQDVVAKKQFDVTKTEDKINLSLIDYEDRLKNMHLVMGHLPKAIQSIRSALPSVNTFEMTATAQLCKTVLKDVSLLRSLDIQLQPKVRLIRNKQKSLQRHQQMLQEVQTLQKYLKDLHRFYVYNCCVDSTKRNG
jgi:hypothetical protein